MFQSGIDTGSFPAVAVTIAMDEVTLSAWSSFGITDCA